MSLSSAVSSFGTLLKIGDGATPTEAFTTIAEVRDISGPGFTLDTEEVTNHSTTGGYKEYIATLKDGGEVTFDLNFFQHATHDDLWDDFEARTRRNFQIVFPITSGDDTLTFAAFVTNIGHEAPVQGVLTRSVTLRVTGAGTWSGA
jgi:predicted secreted protein